MPPLQGRATRPAYLLFVVTLINLLNYFDRLIVIPMFPLIKEELGTSDLQLGLLASIFILVHSVVVLPFGVLADRGWRSGIMSLGVVIWSVATVFSGMAQGFKTLLGARALVGAGEGAYAPAAVSMISDAFPASFRARAQSIFNLGMLLGGVLGLGLGGVLALHFGWRQSFLIASAPGFLLAILAYRLRVPRLEHAPRQSLPVRRLLGNPVYVAILAGGTAAVFAGTSFITWGPQFAMRYYGLTITQASTTLGGVALLGSAIGVLAGGWLADRLQTRCAWGRAGTIATGMLAGTVFLFIAVSTQSFATFLTCVFLATLLLSAYYGPTTAVLHDLVPEAPSAAFALYLFIIHLVGDTVAPALVGGISDAAELRDGLLLSVAVSAIAGFCFARVAWLMRATMGRPLLAQPAATLPG